MGSINLWIKNKLKESVAFFESDSQLKNKREHYPYIIVLDPKSVLEQRRFFSITKKRELEKAVTLFAAQNTPFKQFKFWFDATKADKGYFVNIAYVDLELYHMAQQAQPQGGVIIPETIMYRALRGSERVSIEQVGNYIPDSNYVSTFSRTGTLAEFWRMEDDGISQTSHQQQLLDSLSVKKFMPWLSHWHWGAENNRKLTVKQVLLATALVFGYFAFSSAFVYWQHHSTIASYESNKGLLQELKSNQRDVEDMEAMLVAKNQPFEEHEYIYPLFAVLKSIDTYYEVQGLAVVDGEVQVSGISDDADAVFKTLSQSEQVKDLRYIMPVRKAGKRDSFSIGFKMESI
ncbi:hypothetical protein V1358_15115 [Pseudoalteromonas sp. YIC-656]|uniref:hypothetical protein n=1 Tax=Pseudoalteromonas pernae TaxID=3118054 RepID=UPI0032428670